jgi:hypothetical protein
MKLKSLLFGSAAALVAVTGAQAADMPMAEPVEYVRVCDAFGTGFFYIPGTDTCLKIGGYVRIEWRWKADQPDDADPSISGTGITGIADTFPGFGPGGPYNIPVTNPVDNPYSNAAQDNFTTFARGALSIDARRMTDIGLLRMAFQYFMNVNEEYDASESNADGFALDYAFIQLSNDLGTLTMGHTGSFFNFEGSGTLEGVGVNDPNVTLLGYSFNVGNGASFSVAIEDSNSGGRNGGIEFGEEFDINGDNGNCDDSITDLIGIGYSDLDVERCFADHAGDQWPDIVANIRLDQALGSIQIMGALHQVRDISAFGAWYDTPGFNGIMFETHESQLQDELGWALGAGGSFDAGIFSAFLEGFYGEGIGNYFWSPVSGAATPEAQIGYSGSLDLTTIWEINGNITAGLGQAFEVRLSGSYGDFDGNDVVGVTPDYDEWAVAGDLRWTPVSGFLVGVGVVYYDNSISGDDWKGRVRFQSTF